MAFTTRRGRPRAPVSDTTDRGTPELRAKRDAGLTTEPIDLCLTRQLITPAQHWCGLHWRWLYTLRYGAPSLTARYAHAAPAGVAGDDQEAWRLERTREYQQARTLLQDHRRYDPVMRITVFNELPPFLSPQLQKRAWEQPPLAQKLSQSHARLREGLELLCHHWRHERGLQAAANQPQPQPIT